MNLKNHFLIAMPSLTDPLFEHAVVYICEHNNEGAMGIIINKPIMDLRVEMVLNRLDIMPIRECAALGQSVFTGGPLADEQGFILHTPEKNFASSVQIAKDVMVTTSLDLLRTIGSSHQPKHILLALGYAGWQKQQLEKEIMNNDWLVVKADPKIIFDEPIESRWKNAAKSYGINISMISTRVGNA